MNVLPVYDGRYINIKTIMYCDNVYTNFLCLNVLEDGVECESFAVISVDSLLVYDNEFIPATIFR